jgi:long-chain acyl-CoA synthetase
MLIIASFQGEYIAPEKIEGVYQKHELVAQAFVYGDSLQSTLVGIIHPDKDELTKWAKANPDFANKSFEELCADFDVKKKVLSALTAYGKENGLKGFEQVKKIYLTSEEFTVENDLLTPTFKLKREIAKKKFAKEIETMYAGRSFN